MYEGRRNTADPRDSQGRRKPRPTEDYRRSEPIRPQQRAEGSAASRQNDGDYPPDRRSVRGQYATPSSYRPYSTRRYATTGSRGSGSISRRTFVGIAAALGAAAVGGTVFGLLSRSSDATIADDAGATELTNTSDPVETSNSTTAAPSATGTRTKRHMSGKGTPAKTGSYLETEWVGQEPELPTGCEITAATMMVDHYGFDADKLDLNSYLAQTGSIDVWEDDDGETYGPDPNIAFIGDTSTESGWYCTPLPIVAAINGYLDDYGSKGYRAADITGATPEQLYDHISQGTPVTVWVTIELDDYFVSDSWVSEADGSTVEVSTVDHAMTLVGYDEDEVVLADPLDAIVTYPRTTFEDVFESRGNMAVILQG